MTRRLLRITACYAIILGVFAKFRRGIANDSGSSEGRREHGAVWYDCQRRTAQPV